MITAVILIPSLGCKKPKPAEENMINTATVSTSDVTVFTQETATFAGAVSADGGAAVTARGICWSKNPSPTITDSSRTLGAGTGNFSVDVKTLRLGTKYYVRAFATNSKGTSYGEERSFNTVSTLALGLHYGGGLIFYLDGTKLHGMVIMDTTLHSMLKWGCPTKDIPGAKDTSFGKGASNTAAIWAACPEFYSATDMVNKYVGGGSSDWFLPSTNELRLAWTNVAKKGLGNFKGYQYWTSTQSPYDINSAYVVRFDDGGTQFGNKNNMGMVRAVRSF